MRWLLLGVPLLACACTRHARAPSRPTTTDLVDRMIVRYSKMATYQDHGAAVEWSSRDDGSELSISTTEFETSFVRTPRRLRFAFRSSLAGDQTVLVQRDATIRLYDHGFEVKTIESLDNAQMRLRAPSAGSADVVPSLLNGENPWTCNGQKPTKSEIIGQDWIADTKCTRIAIHRAPCGDVIVCIDEHLLLRKASDWWRASPERQRKSLEDVIEAHPDHREALTPRLNSITSPSTDENSLLFFPQADVAIPESNFELDISE